MQGVSVSHHSLDKNMIQNQGAHRVCAHMHHKPSPREAVQKRVPSRKRHRYSSYNSVCNMHRILFRFVLDSHIGRHVPALWLSSDPGSPGRNKSSTARGNLFASAQTAKVYHSGRKQQMKPTRSLKIWQGARRAILENRDTKQNEGFAEHCASSQSV